MYNNTAMFRIINILTKKEKENLYHNKETNNMFLGII